MATEELQTTRRPKIPEDVQAAMKSLAGYWVEQFRIGEERPPEVLRATATVAKFFRVFNSEAEKKWPDLVRNCEEIFGAFN